jgi:hypothetical protein
MGVLLLSVIVVFERQPFFSSWVDPTYAYLMNGLTLATGHIKSDYVDHPGVSLQIYTGILIKIFHFFRSDADMVRDVLANPEWYLFRICVTSSIGIAACLYIAGRWTLRFTGKIFYALFMQLIHIIAYLAMFFSQNLMSESVLVATGILLAPLMIGYTFREKDNSGKLIIAAGIIIGVMFSGKISSIPILFLWLLIAKSRRHIFILLSSTAISFLIFTIPAWSAAGKFFTWLTNLSTHTGTYGEGKVGFPDMNLFFHHLGELFTYSYVFTFGYLVITIAVAVYFRKMFSRKQDMVSKGSRTIGVIWLVILLQSLMVAKHFSMHYFIPSNLLIIPAVIILMLMNAGNSIVRLLNRRIWVAASLVFSLAALFFWMDIRWYHFFPGLKSPGYKMNRIASHLKYDATLFDNNITGPLPQPALWFGSEYAGDRSYYYKAVLEKIYPPFYRVDTSVQIFRDWNNNRVETKNVLKDSLTILYCCGRPPSFDLNELKWPDKGFSVDTVLFSYRNTVINESMYLFRIKRKLF